MAKDERGKEGREREREMGRAEKEKIGSFHEDQSRHTSDDGIIAGP